MKRKRDPLFFSVGNQINFILITVFLLVVIFSFSVRTTMFDYISRSSSNNNLSYKVLSLKTQFSDCNESLGMYLTTGNRQKLNEFNISSDNSREIISSLLESVNDSENIYLLKSIETSFNNYFLEGCQASFNYNTKNYEYYSKMYFAEIIYNYLQKYCDELLNNLIQSEKETNVLLDLNFNKYSSLLVIFISCFFMFLILAFIHIYKNITHPLMNLVNQVKKISNGDFDSKVKPIKRDNSMGLLIKTFNDMVDNITDMMARLKNKVIIERELLEQQQQNEENLKLLHQAQFLALQSQTNPHFLFNTLNSISRMITLERNEDSLIMVDSLSQLLRYNLSDGTKAVSLKQELDITIEYIKIQQKRFSKRLEYLICVPNELQESILLPKFTLQPLVENAIVHGLEPLKKGGIIKIIGKFENDNIIIEVDDNGVGVSDAILSKIKNKEEIYYKERQHLGLQNTKRRLEIFTGEKDALTINKNVDGGTKVIIKFKANLEVSDDVQYFNC
jgi:sensor histidine kinase YesM